MEKQIVRWSYWLGVASVAITLAWRGLNTFGIAMTNAPVPGQTLWYMSFYKAALLFFLTAIATASYRGMMGEKS